MARSMDVTARAPVRAPGLVRSVAAVMRHELRLAFHSPMSYVLALGFVLSVNVAIFAVGEFLSTNEASVRLFTLFLPWAAVVFVPALAMRAWSAGHDDRGLEFAMSLPLGDGALVAGKFLAGLVVLALRAAAGRGVSRHRPLPRGAGPRRDGRCVGSPRSRCWPPSTPSRSGRRR